MPPTGLFGVKMDEDAMIEAEIAFELENINLDADDFVADEIDNPNQQQDAGLDLIDEDMIPEEVSDYIKHIQQQTKTFEDELAECDELLYRTNSVLQSSSVGVVSEDNKLLEELARETGESPETYKKRILADLENEDSDIFDVPLVSGDVAGDDQDTDNSKALVLVDEKQLEFQRMIQEQMEMLEKRQKAKEEKMKEEIIQEKYEQEKEANQREMKWKEKLEELQREKTMVIKEREIQQQKIEKEIQRKEQEMEEELKQYQEEIHKLEEENKIEQLKLSEAKMEEEQKQQKKRQTAATKIQSIFKGHCVRKEYKKILQEKEEERKKRWEEERIVQVEKEIKERKAEEERLKREEEEKEEMLKRKEEERLQKEKEENERKAAEEKRKADEKRKKAEEEKRKLEEKQRKEEEEKKRKLEEERKKEEERKEKQRQEEEKKRKKAEDERLRKEEEEKKKKEEEEARQRKEEEERQRKEEEEKRRVEEDKRRVEEEKQQQAEEEKRKYEEKKKVEQEKLKKLTEDMIPAEAREDSMVMSNGGLTEVAMKRKEARTGDDSSGAISNTGVSKDETFVKSGDGMKEERNVTNATEKTFVVEKTKKKGSGNQQGGTGMTQGMVREDTCDSMDDFDEGFGTKKDAATRALMEGLPQNLEQRRLQWIKDCLPWSKVSNEPWKLKNPSSKRTIRRPSSAKKLQPLDESIITSAARVATLRQVTTVELHDLPGSSLTTLSQCWGLKCLTMTNCNLTVIEGLQQCKQLQYLDLKENKIEYIDLKDLGNLTFLDLSKNNISVIHGLSGCTNLRWLDLSHNKITRLGGLESLRRLHTFILCHNQLINTSGLGEIPTLQTLSMSNNHLQSLQDIEKLCILQQLDVSSNNLLKLPRFQNHVLLQDLQLEDNSITTLQDLTTQWLPLLQTVNVAKNSIEEVISLENLHLLRNLDISNNQILDSKQITDALCKCVYLENIRVDGNPAVEGTDIQFEGLPRLISVDDVVVKSSPIDGDLLKPRNSFETMCLTQAQLSGDIIQKLQQEVQSLKRNTSLDFLAISEVYFKFCDKSHKVAVEHRYAHEYGEITMAMPMAPSTPKSSNRPRSARSTRMVQREEQYSNPKEMFEKALHVAEKDESTNAAGMKNGLRWEKTVVITAKTVKDLIDKDLTGQSSRTLQDQAATKIQAVWRGHQVRKRTNLHNRAGHQNPGLSDTDLLILKELHRAATKIQAVWRGYSLRLRLERALEFAKFDDEDEFDFEEVDLGDFNFNEDVLDDWKPPETPQIPSNHPVLGKPPIGRQMSPPKIPALNFGEKPQPPSNPRRAWRGMDSPLSEVNQNGHMPHPPPSLASGGESHRTVMSKKEEKLSEEWGFKDTNTAHLMLQRAKKMKYNSERRKKLSKLDPKQRLALFKRLEVTNVVRKPTYQQSKQVMPRKEYFQARQDEMDKQELEKRLMQNLRNSRTYEWLHTQVGDYNVTDSRINQPSNVKGTHGSEGNLPRMDPDITAGRPIRLVASPLIDLQSVESASQQGDVLHGRRFSAGSEAGSIGRLPPIKSNSAGSSNSRKKEKMSWRNPEVNKSVGWGGGKKRGKFDFS